MGRPSLSEINPCRICSAPIKRRRRRDRKAYYYPPQCKRCFKKLRDPSATAAKQSAALRGPNNPRYLPIGSTRVAEHGPGLYYREIKVGDPNVWMYEHRYVMECHLGRPLDRHEHVHHRRKHDTLNNVLSNLVLLTHSEHSAHHAAERRQWWDWKRRLSACIMCNSSKRKHLSQGMCTACYQQQRRITFGPSVRAYDRERYHRAHPDASERLNRRLDA